MAVTNKILTARRKAKVRKNYEIEHSALRLKVAEILSEGQDEQVDFGTQRIRRVAREVATITSGSDDGRSVRHALKSLGYIDEDVHLHKARQKH